MHVGAADPSHLCAHKSRTWFKFGWDGKMAHHERRFELFKDGGFGGHQITLTESISHFKDSCGAVSSISAVIIFVMAIDPDNPLAVEIRQEIAEIYFAACRKMIESLEALETFDRAPASSTRDNGQITRRTELFEETAERVSFVVIQREAMNLPCFVEFFDD
jgi:hypothetical protein